MTLKTLKILTFKELHNGCVYFKKIMEDL